VVRGYYSLSQTKKQVLDLALENYIAYLNSRNMKKLFGKSEMGRRSERNA
jgi:hypothetical protein